MSKFVQIPVIKSAFINTLCAAILLLSAVAANAQSQYTYTTLGVPLGYDTYATGISGTNIVGYYDDSNGTHGYLYDGTNYTTFDVPGAVETYANGICGTNIVGYYSDTNNVTHGFLYDGSNYTTLDMPGEQATYATGISGTNIVGYYEDASGTNGFLFDGSNYLTLNVPGAMETYANGICGTNIVGYYYDTNSVRHGFLYDGSNYTTLDVPGAQFTYANGISGTNIVGYYQYGGNFEGFLYDGTNFTTLYAPLAEDTEALGISGSSIVGAYIGDYSLNYAEYPFLATLNAVIPPVSSLLQIEPGDGVVILQWPTNYADLVLQTWTNLDGSDTWTNYPATPVVNGTNFNVTVVPVEAQRYFRLTESTNTGSGGSPGSGGGSVSPLDEWTFNQTLADSGTGSNDLIGFYSPGYVPGLNGFVAISFDGTSQYAISDNNLGITGLNFTFTGWISSTNDAPDQNIFVWEDSALGLYLIIGGGATLIGGTGKTGWVTYGDAPASCGASSAWFYALVNTPTGFIFYTNGVVAGTGPPLFDDGDNPIPAAPVTIGYTLSQGYGLAGTVQDFQIFNTNLTSCQVSNLYSAGAQ
jgi:hypothetical protein